MLTLLPCCAKSNSEKNVDKKNESVVFTYQIPDDEPKGEVSDENKSEEKTVITSDDVTADTSGKVSEDEDVEEDDDELETYRIDDMYSDVLQGYAEYNEEDEDAITLDDYESSKLSIKDPTKISTKDYTSLKTSSLKLDTNKYSKFSTPEYSIFPMSSTNYRKLGGFSAGTIYSQGIDYGELEQSSGVFSRYQYKHLGLSVSYMKTVNSTNNNYNDQFYVAPEWKLNDYLTLREILSADITKNRQKAEFVVSINPFGQKDSDRLNLEFGVNQTYYMDTATTKNQFKFSTKFKL